MSSESMGDSLQGGIWRVAALLERLPAAPRTGYLLHELAGYFAELAGRSGASRIEIEERIWTIWCAHADPVAQAEMSSGIGALAAGDLSQAEAVFDKLTASFPAWAETWNKRATVYFLQGRDSDSVRDIHRTLELEPRHFGALGGFAQICMRNGAPDAARAALERLLAVNPRAPGIAEAVAAIGRSVPDTMH